VGGEFTDWMGRWMIGMNGRNAPTEQGCMYDMQRHDIAITFPRNFFPTVFT